MIRIAQIARPVVAFLFGVNVALVFIVDAWISAVFLATVCAAIYLALSSYARAQQAGEETLREPEQL